MDGAAGGVGPLRGGKLRAAETGRCSATAQRAVCRGEASAPSVRSASARGRGRRPLLRRGLCRWSPRRRNMASKAAPSCRLVFCLLISAAVLRPGKSRGLGAAPGRPGPGGRCLGPGPRAPHPGGRRARADGEGKGPACGHRAGPGFPHLCRMFEFDRLAQLGAATGGTG